MTMAARPPLPSSADQPRLEAGNRLDQPTFHARYEQMPRRVKAELVGGVVYIPSPAPGPRADLAFCLVYYKASTPGIDTSLHGTTILGHDSEVQPDAHMRIRHNGQTRLNDEDYVVGCPELICEVANSSVSYDLHIKRDDYERYGAQEYLAAVVSEDRVVRFTRREGRLVETPADVDGILRSNAFPGLWIDAAAFLRSDTKRLLDVLNQGIATPEHAAFAASLASRRSET